MLRETTSNSPTPVHKFLHLDHLGSITAITDAITGNVIDRLSYDAWGKRRSSATCAAAPVTASYNRGYTGHEHLDDIDIIHMNGRIYEPTLGRMLFPDPVTQAPDTGQKYNRYSYAFNNPLRYTDPTGYMFDDELGGRRFTQYDVIGDIGQDDIDYMDRLEDAQDCADIPWLCSGGRQSPPGVNNGCIGGLTLGAGGCTQVASTVPIITAGDAEDAVVNAIATGAINPGKIFPSPESAATEVLTVLQPISDEFKLEIGGAIFEVGGGYTYNTPTVGTALTHTVTVRGKPVAGYHTHPPAAVVVFSGDDVEVANDLGIPLYMSRTIDRSLVIKVCVPRTFSCRPGFEGQRYRQGEIID